MLNQGLELESEIKALEHDIERVWQQMDRGDQQYKSAADKYLATQDPRKEQQVSACS